MKDTLNISVDNLKSAILVGFKNLFLRHVTGFIINFAGGLILARILGPEIFGLYFISYTIFIIFRGIIDFGIQTHFIRLKEIPPSDEIKTAFSLQQFIAVLCLFFSILIGYIAFKWYGYKEMLYLILSAGFGAYFYIFHSIPVAFLERKLEYDKVGVIEVVEFIAFNLLAVLCVLSGMGIWGLVVGNVCRGFIPAIFALRYTDFKPSILVNKKIIKSLFKLVSKVFYINMSVYITILAPVVLLAGLSVRAYGISQLAYTILGYTTVIPTIFKRISLTAFARIQDKKEKFNKLSDGLLLFLSIGYLPVVVCISAFSSLWIPVVYGNDWLEMEGVLKLAALPFCAIALLSILHSALMSIERYEIVLKQNILHAIVYWITMVFLVKPLGVLSVPVTHIIAIISSTYLFIYGYNKYCGKLQYRTLTSFFLINVVILFLTHLLIQKNLIFVSMFLWVIFIFFIGVKVKELMIEMSDLQHR